jgi:2-polyprenyl-6-methoxyphenol hydroxylase-like FAD-dependent oxidoreductase
VVRRTTFEWALRDAVRREPHVTLRSSTGVQGLLFDGGGNHPHVIGAHLSDGSEMLGDVVACTGRRGDVLPWLSEVGVEVAEEVVNSEITYLTRWYRRPADLQVTVDPRLGGDFGYLKYLAIPCDGDTFSVTLAVRSNDSELRKALLDPDAFDRACHTLPGPDRFFVSDAIEPIGPVRPMGGLINRLRHFTDADGQPLVTGFHAVGDAHTCTNPMYGRGCSLAFVQATLLADAFAAHPTDALARATTYEGLSKQEVEPWYHSAVMVDSFGGSSGAAQSNDGFMKKFGLLVADVMLGRPTDPIIARGLLRMINTLVRPDELMADAEFLSRIAIYFAAPDGDYSDIEALRVSRGSLLTAVAA